MAASIWSCSTRTATEQNIPTNELLSAPAMQLFEDEDGDIDLEEHIVSTAEFREGRMWIQLQIWRRRYGDSVFGDYEEHWCWIQMDSFRLSDILHRIEDEVTCKFNSRQMTASKVLFQGTERDVVLHSELEIEEHSEQWGGRGEVRLLQKYNDAWDEIVENTLRSQRPELQLEVQCDWGY